MNIKAVIGIVILALSPALDPPMPGRFGGPILGLRSLRHALYLSLFGGDRLYYRSFDLQMGQNLRRDLLAVKLLSY